MLALALKKYAESIIFLSRLLKRIETPDRTGFVSLESRR